MKGKTGIAALLLAICLLGGCAAAPRLPDDPRVFEQKEAEAYVYLTYEDKVYLPYCAYDPEYLGECIGYCDIPGDQFTEAVREYVYAVKGCSVDEWLIGMVDPLTGGMVYREVNAKTAPSGLSSDYDWNN